MSRTLPIGAKALDRFVEPAPTGSRVVLDHDPGVEAGLFAHEVASRHAEADREVVYVVTERPVAAVRERMATYDLEPDGDRVRYVDAHGQEAEPSGPEVAARVDPDDPGSVVDALQRLSGDGDRVLVVDRLSTLRDRAGADGFETAWPRLREVMDGYALTFAIFTRWPYEEDLETWLEGFDARISVRTVEGRVALTQYLRFERVAWDDDVEDRPRICHPVRPGGIRIHAPKITVTGPYNAGKSTFVASVSERSVSVDREGTTVALDHGHADIDGVSADLFGTPGQARFDPVLDVLLDRGVGLLVMVDASKPESFQRAEEMLGRSIRLGVPALVVANKQDLDDAAEPGEVIKAMDLPLGVDVIGCQATDRTSCRRVLDELLDRILSRDTIEEVTAA